MAGEGNTPSLTKCRVVVRVWKGKICIILKFNEYCFEWHIVLCCRARWKWVFMEQGVDFRLLQSTYHNIDITKMFTNNPYTGLWKGNICFISLFCYDHAMYWFRRSVSKHVITDQTSLHHTIIQTTHTLPFLRQVTSLFPDRAKWLASSFPKYFCTEYISMLLSVVRSRGDY